MGSLGWPEILLILVVALIIFGPRKLPELGKTLGNSLAQFRRASEDFKRTWEEEVEVEKRRINSYSSDTYGSSNYESPPHTEPYSFQAETNYDVSGGDNTQPATAEQLTSPDTTPEIAEKSPESPVKSPESPVADAVRSSDSSPNEPGAEASHGGTERV